MSGYIKRVFPGGNTPQGFYSFYDYIVAPSANRIFIIKGGPGVGKSTFMKKITERLLELGFDIEYHHCSSDNNSVDGVYVPAIDVAMIDGTAPHIVDPKNPGAVDEIINLGDYWDEAGMRANKTNILRVNKEVGRLFRKAYGYLASAKNCMDHIETCYSDSGALDIGGLNLKALEVIGDIFVGTATRGKASRQRHLFASAITPDGPKNHLDSIVGRLKKRYLISGDWGTGRTSIVRKVADYALGTGYDVEIFHCPMDPVKYDHVVIPELGVAVINNSEPHTIKPRSGDVSIDTSIFVDNSAILSFEPEMVIARELYARLFSEAGSFLSRAKKLHDELETYFVPNMNFEQISKVRERTMERILALASELTSSKR